MIINFIAMAMMRSMGFTAVVIVLVEVRRGRVTKERIDFLFVLRKRSRRAVVARTFDLRLLDCASDSTWTKMSVVGTYPWALRSLLRRASACYDDRRPSGRNCLDRTASDSPTKECRPGDEGRENLR